MRTTLDGGRDEALTAVPVGGPWTYGGHSFGLEPLTLPLPGDSLSPRPDDYGGVPPKLAAPVSQVLDLDEVDGDRRAWFRWITGHQTSFVLWRLLSADVSARVGDTYSALNEIDELPLPTWKRYVDGYSAMLLYSGSCSRSTYHRLIRPSMSLQHPSFSGSWAPDYACVRRLFHDRRLLDPHRAAGPVAAAVDLVHSVHDRVAERLVPEGASLLRASQVKRQDWGDTAFLYDSYFLTRRSPIERQRVVGQLLRRLGAIADDLAANGLYEGASDSGEDTDPSVLAVENRLSDIVRGLIHAVVTDPNGNGDRLPFTLSR